MSAYKQLRAKDKMDKAKLKQVRANKKAVTSNHFANTWRKPEDYNFERKAAPKPCPVKVA